METEVIQNVTSRYGRRHFWLWLTKRPKRMAQFGEWLRKREIPWPTNLWPGTSITSNATKGRISELQDVGDGQTTRFLSVEPQWEDLRIKHEVGQVHWVIQGGESGPGAHAFDVMWARRLLSDCRAQGTPYFLKQLGENPREGGVSLPLKDRHGGQWGEWPADLRVREIPDSVDSR